MDEIDDEQLREVVQAYGGGDPLRLLRALDRLDWSYTGQPWVMLARAEALTAIGCYDQANELLEQAVVLWPDRSSPWLALARFAIGDGDHQRALHAAQRALEIDPSDGNALWLAGTTSLDLGQRDLARDYSLRAVAVAGDDPAVLRLASLTSLGNDDRAAETWARAALVVAPGSPDSTRALAGALEAQGRLGEAVRLLEGVVGTTDPEGRAERQLGRVAERQVCRRLCLPVLLAALATVLATRTSLTGAVRAVGWISAVVLVLGAVALGVLRATRLDPVARRALRDRVMSRGPDHGSPWKGRFAWAAVVLALVFCLAVTTVVRPA